MTFSIITSAYQQLPLIQKTEMWISRQTFKDFEWIIADDGSTDGLREWTSKFEGVELAFPVRYVRHEKNIGYRYGQIINKAAEVASGEYLVWINGDSYPKEDFLQELLKVLRPERLVNGIRMNVDRDGLIVSPDWRLRPFNAEELEDARQILQPSPWSAMTLNSMSMSATLFRKLGGMCDEYVGYGKEDWDLFMRAYFDGAEFWWATKAVLYTLDHPPTPDKPENTELFNRRKELFAQQDKTQEKMRIILDPNRAKQKAEMQAQRLHEIERNERRMQKEDESRTGI